jgi:hypothetical protein
MWILSNLSVTLTIAAVSALKLGRGVEPWVIRPAAFALFVGVVAGIELTVRAALR